MSFLHQAQSFFARIKRVPRLRGVMLGGWGEVRSPLRGADPSPLTRNVSILLQKVGVWQANEGGLGAI